MTVYHPIQKSVEKEKRIWICAGRSNSKKAKESLAPILRVKFAVKAIDKRLHVASFTRVASGRVALYGRFLKVLSQSHSLLKVYQYLRHNSSKTKLDFEVD